MNPDENPTDLNTAAAENARSRPRGRRRGTEHVFHDGARRHRNGLADAGLESTVIRNEQRSRLVALLHAGHQLEAEILLRRFVGSATVAEIARATGMSKEDVFRMEARALDRLADDAVLRRLVSGSLR